MTLELTEDGRYLIVRGRLWRTANPTLEPSHRQSMVNELMKARRAVRLALIAGDPDALLTTRTRVQLAKVNLGELGPVWWSDGAPDFNRWLVKNTPYALELGNKHGSVS